MSQMKMENIVARTNSVIEWLDTNEIALDVAIRASAEAILATEDLKMANILYSSMRGQVTLFEGHPLSGGGGNGYTLPQEAMDVVTGVEKDSLDVYASNEEFFNRLAMGLTPKRVNKNFAGFTGETLMAYLVKQFGENLTAQHKAGNWSAGDDSVNWEQYHEQKEAQKNA